MHDAFFGIGHVFFKGLPLAKRHKRYHLTKFLKKRIMITEVDAPTSAVFPTIRQHSLPSMPHLTQKSFLMRKYRALLSYRFTMIQDRHVLSGMAFVF